MTTPVRNVNGIGPKTAEYLQTKRVNTAEALVKFGAEKLALAPGFSPGRAESVIDAARELLGVEEVSGLAISFTAPETSVSPKPGKGGKKNKDKKDKKKNRKDKKDKKKDKKGKKDKKDKKKNRKDKKKNK